MTSTISHDTESATAATKLNNFALKLANVNGTGSASANSLLMQAIFRMGIPVSGKNLFPSNIQGLPTWYEIRVNRSGYTARALDYDLMVAMNSQTYAEDIAEVASGGYVLYDSSWPLDAHLLREDVTFLGVPLAKMCLENFNSSRERVLMKNIAYAGALVALLDLDLEVIATLLSESYSRNEKLLASNQRALRLGYDYATQHFSCPLELRVAPMDETSHSILIDGNTASALGCLYAGATVAGWYPITPATALMDNFSALCAKYRREPVDATLPGAPDSFQNNYLILQAEDEIAAIGMVLGASWSGARAFTSTSGPGISLMSELLGLAYYTEIPAVIFDVQRTGPSTGMPTRTQQADILLCAYASHGDTKHILLFPANPHECFEFAVRSFDIAERFQTPVFVLSDLDIGMNDWVVPELTWDDDYVPDRGRVLDDRDLAGITEFFRYTNEDADFVTPRTVPGSDSKGAYFIRGSGHDKYGRYTEVPAQYQEVVDRLKKKHAAAARYVPAPVEVRRPGAHVGIITLGSCDLAVREAIEELDERGIVADFLRVRGFPFVSDVRRFVEDHEHCFVVEQNRDAQLRSLIALETEVDIDAMHPVVHYGGFPLSARQVVDSVLATLEVHS
ncbi:MAG: 2-oxoacid:acceptor oxidoreductase subunit alpha [Acidobacteriota bacterium]|nr:2-oxoacid:acceptor oxidoreductase subunit alpha [Acidobacteriota bacterium]MDE3030795.1 2-oxoacid:acceptor oxidoreductase subunit alpha [Acidobacteriota bacterium]MDE3093921.1 2-oxoacid:acceptor oxidoreductase subunit alpha [Acidobacteriota bacterium]MDE3138694.1 2-oxoacid:acceptor oxidoreductase subunit alpha [Acidobacteriota bacterium]MDE3146919.1 2-oxoacid:acceptor oxidoreductase subunit alpha [Acidobacteriota bacterium]